MKITLQYSEAVTMGVKALLIYTCLCIFSIAMASEGKHSEHTLTIITENGSRHTYQAPELLGRPDVVSITIENTPAYPHRKMAVKAIQFPRLMKDFRISPEATIEFMATDGFTSPIDARRVMNTEDDKSLAYLAIEDPDHKWPAHSSGKGTAGPYYLFWINPELSDIGREEWPYKLDTITINKPVKERYAAIFPGDHSGSEDHSAGRGFRVFMKNCIACHKMNKVGSGTIGPDLNYPMSPVEYFKEGILRKFIRDPQSIRHYPGSKMIGFGEDALSDEELDQLISYFEYMAERNKQ